MQNALYNDEQPSNFDVGKQKIIPACITNNKQPCSHAQYGKIKSKLNNSGGSSLQCRMMIF